MKDVNYDFTYEVGKQVQEDINFLLNSKKDKDIFKRYLTYRKYASVLDPDNSSNLLQEIYKEKWNETYLKNCLRTEDSNLVYSDTMTSAQTLLNHFYKEVGSSKEGLDWKKYAKEHPKSRCSEVALRNIYQEVLNGSKDYPVFCKYFLDDNSLVCKFLKCYHTIGNYIPVPKYFNISRSNMGLHDRFDLTLIKIKEYYDYNTNQEVLKELLHIKGNEKEEIIETQKWLDGFGSWKTFITENYLQDYVDTNDKDYPIKEEFEANWDSPLDNFDYLGYFSKVTDLILKRGERILSHK